MICEEGDPNTAYIIVEQKRQNAAMDLNRSSPTATLKVAYSGA